MISIISLIILIGTLIMNVLIGEVAEKYETGGKGPGFISDGDKWDPGGDSYGSYQLATKVGTLQGYLKTNLPYVSELKKYPIKSAQFNKLWKEIAAKDPEGFKQSQFDYVCTISYNPARKYADNLGWPDSVAVNSAIFSISNQHGKWKKIFDKVGGYSGEIDLLNKLYKRRAAYVESLNMSQHLKDNIIKSRCEEELEDTLKLVSN